MRTANETPVALLTAILDTRRGDRMRGFLPTQGVDVGRASPDGALIENKRKNHIDSQVAHADVIDRVEYRVVSNERGLR